MKIGNNKQKGFTLIEILISISLLMVIIGATMPVLSRMIDFKSNLDTETRIQILGDSIEKWYEEHAWDYGQIDSANIPLPVSGFIVNNGATVGEGWEALANYYYGSTDIIRNGNNHAFNTYVSEPLTKEYKGILVPYHIIILTSSSEASNKVVEDTVVTATKSTFDQETGAIEFPEDSLKEDVYVINSFNIQKEYINQSIDRIEQIASSYERLYRSTYLSKGKEPSINYFANGKGDSVDEDKWDMTSPINNTCQTNSIETVNGYLKLGANINDINLLDTIGMSKQESVSAWGEDIRVLNCSYTDVLINGETVRVRSRSPNDSLGNNTVPFSAIIGFHLPNGELYSKTITSKF